MKQIILTASIAIFGLAACTDKDSSTDKKTTTDTSAVKKMDDPAPPPMDSAASMKAMHDFATPGSMQQMLAKSTGTWSEDITMWMSAGAPPSKTTSKSVNTMILGGRYLESRHTGNFMGMPFEGLSILGYNNGTKSFQSSWVDNFGTGVTLMEGKWDSTSRSITSTGKTFEPTTGKEMSIKQVFTLVDDNHQKMEMYAAMGGKESKTMEILLKKQ